MQLPVLEKANMIKFYILRTYIWNYYRRQGTFTFDTNVSYIDSIERFAQENNCIVDGDYTSLFKATEEDHLILKIKHPALFKYP